jgi:hypothetical protein
MEDPELGFLPSANPRQNVVYNSYLLRLARPAPLGKVNLAQRCGACEAEEVGVVYDILPRVG